MQLTAYPYDFEYKLEDNKVYVYSYAKLDDGSKICIKHAHEVFFYASLDNINVEEFKKRLFTLVVEKKPFTAKVIKYQKVTKEFNSKTKNFFKIYVNFPKAVPLLAKKIQDWGVECFEKDILFIHRYLRDVNITPMTEVEVEGEYITPNSLEIPTFLVSKLTQKNLETRKNWKILALDIETYSKNKEINPYKNPILMVALYGKNFRKVITWKKFKTKDKTIEFVNSEKELLQLIIKYIHDFSPEVLTGYFSDGFDLPYIQTRCEINKVKFNVGINNSEMFVRKGTGPKPSEAKITGIIHLDMFKFIKQIFGLDLKVESYSLDTIAEKLLGHRKHVVDLNKLSEYWDNHPEKLEQFCKYNLQDSKLTYDLCDKLMLDMIEFSLITGLPTFDVTRMRFGRLVESYILKKAIQQNIVAPNRPGDEEIGERMSEHIQGAFVFEPTPGLYQNITVFDFRSLYPTIIISHNLGPGSLGCECCKDNIVPGEKYWFCKKKQDFLPSLLKEIIARRIVVKKQIKQSRDKTVLEAKSYALKIMANSFYGYLGFYGARWYSIESAASTTAYARHYIKDTIKKAEEFGFEICYSDTDSMFLTLGKKSIDNALEFMKKINDSLPGNMELEYEGYFPRGIFVSTKSSSRGAKKKYALLKEDGSIKITGFETVRRNWSFLAKEVQRDVLKFVLENKVEEALAYIKGVVNDLKKGIVPLEKLILKTQITRPLDKYKAIGPHIYVARQMAAKGELVGPGTLVKYIITQGSGLVRDRARLPQEVKEGEYASDYYINHQIIPAVSSILAIFGYSEEDLFNESSQKGLGSFF